MLQNPIHRWGSFTHCTFDSFRDLRPSLKDFSLFVCRLKNSHGIYRLYVSTLGLSPELCLPWSPAAHGIEDTLGYKLKSLSQEQAQCVEMKWIVPQAGGTWTIWPTEMLPSLPLKESPNCTYFFYDISMFITLYCLLNYFKCYAFIIYFNSLHGHEKKEKKKKPVVQKSCSLEPELVIWKHVHKPGHIFDCIRKHGRHVDLICSLKWVTTTISNLINNIFLIL